MNRIQWVLLACAVTVGCAGGERAFADATQSEPTPTQVDAIFAPWNRTDSPGCALAVMQHGHIVYEHGYGMADLSHDAVITPNTPFHVASVSKQFTAAAILLLVDQGEISLDDDVRKYLPELPDFGVRITIRDLLHHTSGLRDQWDLLELAGYRYSLDLITDQDVMNLVLRQRELNFEPGSEYLYSNTGFTLLGQVVKRITKQSLREFTTKNIFGPLGMTNSHFRDDHAEINKGEALGYVHSMDGVYELSVTNFDTVGATSLYTTVEDLAKWDENFYAPRIGGRDLTEHMTEVNRLTSGKDNFYAMGLMSLRYRGLPIVDHSGADAGYRAEILRFPGQHFSVAALCNTPPSVGVPYLTRRVADLYLAGRFPEPAATLYKEGTAENTSIAPSSDVDGYYRSQATGEIVRLGSVNGVLVRIEGTEKTALRTDGHGHFLFPESIDLRQFEPAQGRAQRFLVQGEGRPAETWVRLPAFSPPVATQKNFAGSYYSEELDTSVDIANRGGVLILNRKKSSSEELVPIASDLFLSSLGPIAIKRDSSGQVSGILVTTGRVRNLKFLRRWNLSASAP